MDVYENEMKKLNQSKYIRKTNVFNILTKSTNNKIEK